MNNILKYFYEITSIPRSSGNEKEISNYLVDFAIKNNLEYIKDNYNNVIIKKNNNLEKTIILQSHMDMVFESNGNSNKIEIIEDNGYLKAKNTSLGADNGIGMAIILDLLENNNDINIEAIFTSEEETTMNGAFNINLDDLKGKMLLNLDGFTKNTIIIESACFYDIILNLNYEFLEENNNNIYEIVLNGLDGGHSGYDIDKNKGNSNIILCNLLKEIKDIKIYNFLGGTKFNVIPNSSKCIFSTNKSLEELKLLINNYLKEKSNNYNNMNITINKIKNNNKLLSNKDSINFINSILNIKDGVINKNNNFVTTSSNLGVVDLKENIFKIGIRSSRKKEEKEFINELKEYSNKYNYKYIEIGYQPGFESNINSKMIKTLIKSYPLDNNKLNIISEHIATEVGILKSKMNDIDVAIISPEIIDAHTINERVEIESIKTCKDWINNFIKNI